MGFDIIKQQIFRFLFYRFSKPSVKVFGRNIFIISIQCFVLSICITSCAANHVFDTNAEKTKLGDTRIRTSKYLKSLFKRDVNQNIDSFECKADEDCNQNIINTICVDSKCVCSEGYKRRADNNTCVRTTADVTNDQHNQTKNHLTTDEQNKSHPKPKEKYNGSHMLPIMIVLGVMFVGMCVALNLFSRARFRQSRGIFSKPHLVKFNNNGSTKSNYKTRRTSPPNPNNLATGGGAQGITVPDSQLTKNGSYVSIALDS